MTGNRATVLRRLVMVPLVVLLDLLVLALAPLALLISVVVAVAHRSSRAPRTVLLVAAYAGLELAALGRLAALHARGARSLRRSAQPCRESMARSSAASAGEDVDDAGQQLAQWLLAAGKRCITGLLDIRIEIDEGSPATGSLAAAPHGVVVLARHCGPGDSLLVAWLLAVEHGLALHVVLKGLLRVEPVVDLAGDVLPLCFVGGRGGAAKRSVAALAESLGQGDALLLFPEGGNFSTRRWYAGLQWLQEEGQRGRFRLARARRRTHTLVPRTGGVLAAVTAAPEADVVLIAHTGFSPDGRNRPWWRLPVHRTFGIRVVQVPATEVPREEQALEAWLDTSWDLVDTWVDAQAALEGTVGGQNEGSPRPAGGSLRQPPAQ